MAEPSSDDTDWIDMFEEIGVTAWRAFWVCLAVAFFLGMGIGALL